LPAKQFVQLLDAVAPVTVLCLPAAQLLQLDVPELAW